MTDQTIQPVDVSVNHLLTMVRNQISNLGSLVETHASLVTESLDSEVEQYNSLVDALEKAESDKTTLEIKVKNLETELEDSEATHVEQLSLLRSEFSKLKVKLETWNEMKAELNRLKSLDPDSLKKRLVETKKLADERLQGMQKTKRENGEYRREKTKHLRRIAELEEAGLMAADEIKRLQTQVTRQDGDVLNTVFKGKDGLECFLYLYHWGLSFKPANGEITTISDIDFHVVMRTNWGINLSVSISDWLVPFLPTCSDLNGKVPQSIYDKVSALFLEQLSETHTYLIERIDWAKDKELAECGVLTEKQIALLSAADFYSVYSVMHLPDNKLAERVKGLSPKSAGVIRQVIREKIVKPWCIENWTKEQIKIYG